MKLPELLKKIPPQKRSLLVLGLGVLGMLLILFSRPTAAPPPQAEAESITVKAQSEYLEEKLLALVLQIDGVGRAQIMVTLENSGETVYVQEEKRVLDRQTWESSSLAEKESSEQKYVLVDGGNGRRQALVETQREPKIQGVVVICEGAADIRVQARVVNVVTTALNIPSTRVCVEKIKAN